MPMISLMRVLLACAFLYAPLTSHAGSLADTTNSSAIKLAQATVAPSCPTGYVFSGGQCVRSTAPAPSCPNGYVLSGGQCVASTVTAPPIRTASAQPAPRVNMALELQTQLKRIGCLTGQVDGVWGGSSRTALARFASQAGLALGSEPTQQAINEARNTAAPYCQPVRRAAPTQKRRRKKSSVSANNEWSHMSCSKLWYFRNQLFAQHGYCFKSARGKKRFHNNPNFPDACNGSFRGLPAYARKDVAQIKAVERQKGC